MTDINDPSPSDARSPYPGEPIIATAVILFIFWSTLTGFSLYLNQSNLRKEVITLATAEARGNWNKDQAFRGWATRHGGVYVRPDKRTPPSPYLSHIPNRDLVTTDGTALTLMNPAYMMRQMTEEYEELYGIKGSITGKILLNPDNAPDPWERQALDDFDRGKPEVIEETIIDGETYVRYMKPMIMEQGCVKCHGHLGFKVGDIRGGVSVSIPLEPYLNAAAATSRTINTSHAAVWLLGCLGIAGFSWFTRNRESERHRLQQEIVQHQNMLEQRLKERTRELKFKENELLDSQARAHHANKMASLGEMASCMAHEINSPLQVISFTAFSLKRNFESMDKTGICESMDKVDTAVTNISRIIESLKIMSRDSASDPCVNTKIRDIIHDATAISIERFKIKGITFNVCYHGDSETSSLDCQRLQIAQVLINLLNNAFDAAMASKDKWIRLDVYDNGQSIDMSVTDSGAGVPVEIQDRIYEPLYTSKDIGQGVGLGLSISSEIIRNHSGTLELDTQSSNTCFVISLPKSQPATEPRA